jgi:hypothetical protein
MNTIEGAVEVAMDPGMILFYMLLANILLAGSLANGGRMFRSHND